MREFQWPSVAPRATTLTTLVLRSTICGEDTLEKLLRATSSLKRLYYNRFYDNGTSCQKVTREYRVPCPPSLSKALQHVHRTLEVLTVIIENYRYANHDFDQSIDDDIYRGSAEGLGSLSNFTYLREMEFPVELLLGQQRHTQGLRPTEPVSLQDLFPGSITEICLRNDLSNFVADYPWHPEDLIIPLRAFLQGPELRARLPHLRTLHLSFQNTFWWSGKYRDEFMMEVAEHCLIAGIDFVQRYERRHYCTRKESSHD